MGGGGGRTLSGRGRRTHLIKTRLALKSKAAARLAASGRGRRTHAPRTLQRLDPPLFKDTLKHIKTHRLVAYSRACLRAH